MTTWERWKEWPVQIGIAVDQLVNTLIPPITTLGYADETLSARSWRAWTKKRWFGRITKPVIDTLFFWQKAHCETAYWSEMDRTALPPEYRPGSQRTLP